MLSTEASSPLQLIDLKVDIDTLYNDRTGATGATGASGPGELAPALSGALTLCF